MSGMFPHTVTLYNVEKERAAADVTKKRLLNHITVLADVFLDEGAGAEIRDGGAERADTATLFIPFSATAVDGITGAAKQYVTPKAFDRLEDKSGAWTLLPGTGCFFARGRVVEPDLSFEEISKLYDSVYTVSRIAVRDFGSADLQHFEVGGK